MPDSRAIAAAAVGAAVALIAVMVAVARGPGGSLRVELPIEYRVMNRMATCRGNHRIRIEPDGAVYLATNASECPAGKSWSTPFPPEAARRLTEAERAGLRREIDRSGVLALDPETDPGGVADGIVEEIELMRGADSRTVRVVNASPASFVRARAAILRVAGESQ